MASMRVARRGRVVAALVAACGFAVMMTSGAGSIPASGVTWIAIAALVLLASGAALVAAHELGHAVVGRIVGWEIRGVTLGTGRCWGSFRVAGVSVELRGALQSGLTFGNPTGRRSRDITMFAGGVLAEAAVIVGLLLWMPEDPVLWFLVWSVVAIAAVHIAVNLLPVHGGPHGQHPSDGLQIWRTFVFTQRWDCNMPEATRLTAMNTPVHQALTYGDVERAAHLVRLIDPDARAGSDDAATFGSALLLADDPVGALRWLGPAACRDDALPLTLNNAAWAAVLTFDRTLLPDADRWSELAFRHIPYAPWCQNTRGATLALLGRYDEAFELQSRALLATLTPPQRAYVSAFAALAAHGTGATAKALGLLAEAESLDPRCPALPRVRSLVTTPAR